VSMPFGYVSPEQITKDKADFARKGIARGRPLVVLEYAEGIAFVADNPSTHLHKIGELYDRIALAAVGRVSEFENLRVAGVRLADIRGYSYGREDVTSRSIATFYSQTLGQIFMQEPKPYEVELCVAEVGLDGASNALSDELTAELQKDYDEGMDLDAALRLALRALRQAGPQGEPGSRLEVAVLERDRGRRAFRRLPEEDVASRTADATP